MVLKQRDEPARFGIVIYPGVEPIDIGGTAGVISMARRVLPAIECVTVAAEPGPRRAGRRRVDHRRGGLPHLPDLRRLHRLRRARMGTAGA